MSETVRIVSLTPENYREFGCPCFLNPKQSGHLLKLEWLQERFSEGFTVKLLFVESEKKTVGFIEYVPGEFAWRAVDVARYLFIHCIWISPNKYKEKGYGSVLIEECLKDAQKQGKNGVAVIVSDGSFMAGQGVFLKNGFEVVERDDQFSLLAKPLREGDLPKFRDWRKQLAGYQGLNIVYSKQCPWVVRFISELSEIIQGKGLKIRITELTNAKQTQNAPSIYATFTLINDGKTYADHYISSTRFLNILKKELKLIK